MTRNQEYGPTPPPGAPRWVAPELLQDTVETWQLYYSQPLTAADALDMLLAVTQMEKCTPVIILFTPPQTANRDGKQGNSLAEQAFFACRFV